ncbi:WD40 repeat-like protein [Aureobasidium namibiae CBS 147.97]|uniref:WD40 repeat-like protein n=1 Tax=Aureobasidium namibiae CBS 147.97 TaxID=1043004 RepID=A0A074XS95_9PEZI
MSMITATTWVPRGYAAPFPTKYTFDEEEFERISKLAKLELDDAKDDLADAQAELNGEKAPKKEESDDEDDDDTHATGAATQDIDLQDDDLKEYDLENYDNDDAAENEQGEGDASLSMFGNVRNLAFHGSNAEDPYITLKEGEESDDEEREEMQILPTDNMLLAARIEDEVAHLECYVYEDDADNLYVHHDIMLPAIPLAVEWLNMPISKPGEPVPEGQKANFVAIATMDPDIEIWDLDTIDCMYPNAVLGQGTAEISAAPTMPGQKKKKKRKSKQINDKYHIDSVLALSANRFHRNLLASASADCTVKLWDLSTGQCAKSYNDFHTDKVCALHFHPHEAHSTILLTGSYDRTVCVADLRAAEGTKPKRWGVDSDVEQVRWDPHNEHVFYVSTESGILYAFDARNAPSSPEKTQAIWRLQAHESAVSSFALNPTVPGFIATASTDRTVKLWNVDQATNQPSMVVSRDLGVGRVFSTNFAPDDAVAFRLAVAGSKGAVQVWDTSTNRAVREAFAGRVKGIDATEVKERLVAVANDDEASDDSDEDEEENEDEAGADERGWESMSE